jgi:hypothetical protein
MSMGRSPAAAAAAVSLFLGGCVTADFREPVGDFTTAMSQANGIIGGYFTGMNAYERDLYLQQALQNPQMEVVAVDAAGRRTGLMPTFSPAAVSARLNAVRLLSVYGERLAALAGADAPARFQAGSKVLGENLTSLAATFNALAGSGDSSAGSYIGPITTIVGVFGEMILEGQRETALRRAVQDGAPAVNAVLNQLERDLRAVVQPLQTTGALQRASGSIAFYNANRRALSLEQRRTLLAQIGDEMAAYEVALATDPGEAVDGIRDAHAALVDYARSSRRPEDLNALIAAINTFNRRLEPLADAVQQLRKA